MIYCKQCSGIFAPSMYHRIYCSKECYHKHIKIFYKEKWAREKAASDYILSNSTLLESLREKIYSELHS